MEWKMPDLGEGVLEGEVVLWNVKVGDEVKVDQPIVEVMTDKATVELPCTVEGKVQKILVKVGDMAKVGEALAEISTASESAEETPASSPEASKKTEKPALDKKNPATTSSASESKGSKPLAAPAVRSLAKDLGLDLKTVEASDPSKPISKADVIRSMLGTSSAPVASKTPILREGNETIVPFRGMRRKIAEHMSFSRKTVAHLTHMDEIDLTKLMEVRTVAKEAAEKDGVKLTILAYFVQAVALALKKFPPLNASLDDAKQEILLRNHYHIGIAASTEEGLIVPVIKNADQLSLMEIAKEIVRLADLAREAKIERNDLTGGTFTITNIGSIGGTLSVPIVNHPEVAILGLHKIQEKPVVRDGEIVIRKMMNVSLSADHRVVDGSDVAKFCNEVIKRLESPNE